MAALTFGEIVRRVVLRVPDAPYGLVQSWVQDAYDQVLGKRHWAFLRAETLITTLASRSLTVTFTNNSTAITSVAGFVASDAGRQIRVSGGPVYTIDSYSNASAAVLEEAYAGSSGAATATIQDIYLPMPTDFRAFLDVTDFSIQRPVAWWIARERLDLFDPGRVSSDSRFRVLASYKIASDTSRLGRVLYEAWPYPTAVGSYRAVYFKRTDALSDDDTLKGVLATYARVLEQGALAECALWPGTLAKRNPYFNLALGQQLKARFEETAQQIDVMDDDQYLMDLAQIDLSKFGLAALSADTTLMRQSDATIADYY